MRTIRTALVAAAALALTLVAAPPAGATEPEVKAPCSADNVDCGDWPEEIPAGSDCTVTVGGETYEGETNEAGVCVCPEQSPPSTTTSSTVPETTTSTAPPETTTSTVPETTTSTVPETTTSTTVVAPSTTAPGQPSTTVTLPSTTTPDLVARPLPPARPAASGQLPRTGNNTGLYVATGTGLVAAGGALVYASRRRFATR